MALTHPWLKLYVVRCAPRLLLRAPCRDKERGARVWGHKNKYYSRPDELRGNNGDLRVDRPHDARCSLHTMPQRVQNLREPSARAGTKITNSECGIKSDGNHQIPGLIYVFCLLQEIIAKQWQFFMFLCACLVTWWTDFVRKVYSFMLCGASYRIMFIRENSDC